VHRRAVNLRVKLGDGMPGRVVDHAVRRVGRSLRPDPVARAYPSWTAVRPENALDAAIAAVEPQVVVVNSIDLPAWRQVRDDLQRRGIPVALYMREETSLLHLSHSKVPPDVLLANATGHAEAAAALGYHATVIPSVVDCTSLRVESTRERVLFVNPIEMYGVDVALALAARRPDVPFAFVESWPLADEQLAELRATLAALPNVELRRFVPDPRELYRDTRILLAPYRYPGRSRVIAEAHCNGIPVLVSNGYGLAEAVGPGGLLADPDGPIDAWVDALARLWDEPAVYDEFAAAAREWSARPEMQPDTVVRALESALAAYV
jgi:glycosyltransferase involved in cell wall biosynthesis